MAPLGDVTTCISRGLPLCPLTFAHDAVDLSIATGQATELEELPSNRQGGVDVPVVEGIFVGGGLVVVLAVTVLGGIWLWRPRDYFTWFLLHLAVGVYGISAVVLLAMLHDLSPAATAILSSLIAYSLGASAHAGNSQTHAPAKTAAVTAASQGGAEAAASSEDN